VKKVFEQVRNSQGCGMFVADSASCFC